MDKNPDVDEDDKPLVHHSPMYSYVRSRQLEGTFPGDHRQGCWAVSAMRIAVGWGSVPETCWPYNGRAENWPPVEPPGLDEIAKQYQVAGYQRVRNAAGAKRLIASEKAVIAGLAIDASWNSPDHGIVGGATEDGRGHCVVLIGYNDEAGRFTFVNSWGVSWGEEGYGELPYEYFDERVLDAWVLRSGPRARSDEGSDLVVQKDPLGGVFHRYEILDPEDPSQRVAWLIAVERDGFEDIEELFVMPSHRNRGLGHALAAAALWISEKTGQPLRMWISHADAHAVNSVQVSSLLKQLSLRIGPSEHRWAAFKAT